MSMEFKLQFIVALTYINVGGGPLDAPVILHCKITLPQAIIFIFLRKI